MIKVIIYTAIVFATLLAVWVYGNNGALLQFRFQPVALLYLFALLANISLVFILLLLKNERSSGTFLWFLFFISFFTIGITSLFLANISANQTTIDFWTSFGYVGWVFIPNTFLAFSLSYVGQEKVLRDYLYAVPMFLPSPIFLFIIWNTEVFWKNGSAWSPFLTLPLSQPGLSSSRLYSTDWFLPTRN